MKRRWRAIVAAVSLTVFAAPARAQGLGVRAGASADPDQFYISLGVSLMAQERPPQILQIVRESLKQSGEAAYKAIEEDAARICADLECPNSHLAMESLTGPKEVWWLTPYESESDRQRVADGYASNHALMAALQDIRRRKQGLVGTPIDILANYRADPSRNASWKVGGTRFFVVTVTNGDPPVAGAVFAAPDGTRFIFRPAGTRHEADMLAAEAGPKTTTVFAVRPYWGMPAKDWIAADPEFWKPNPMARSK